MIVVMSIVIKVEKTMRCKTKRCMSESIFYGNNCNYYLCDG